MSESIHASTPETTPLQTYRQAQAEAGAFCRGEFCDVDEAELLVIVPQARRQNITWRGSIELALLLWGCSVFAVWACLRARRKVTAHAITSSMPMARTTAMLWREEHSSQTFNVNEPGSRRRVQGLSIDVAFPDVALFEII